MQMIKLTIWPVFMALCLMTTATATFAGVYKWVDENGRAHYTEQPPTQREHSQLRATPEPENPQPGTGNGAVFERSKQTRQERLNEVNARLQAERNLDASKKKQRAEERRREDQAAEEQKVWDDKLIAKCNRNHEVYCDDGAENIRNEESKRNAEAEMNAVRAFGNRY